MQLFPTFLLSGTGIDFKFVKEFMESSTMKELVTNYEVESPFKPMTKSDVEKYAAQYLQDHNVEQIDEVVTRITNFLLCHGRPRFVAYILDKFMRSNDIDDAIGKFVNDLSNVDGDKFPLKFFKRDLDNKESSMERIISGDALLPIIKRGLVQFITKGIFRLTVQDNVGAAAIRYGLGYGRTSRGRLQWIDMQELAIVYCLRYFVPFSELVKTFAQQIVDCRNSQMVGYLVEYLVAFALVANCAVEGTLDQITVWQQTGQSYLFQGNSTHIYFPDHMYGPDIIYKCTNTKTVYIVQVKFVKGISKQETANACDTTDPDRFYCKRNGGGVLKGFEDEKPNLLNALLELQREGFDVQQMLFIHTGGRQSNYTRGATLITKDNSPTFFDKIGTGIWEFLDSIRDDFN
ncbi:hypothetical protein HDU91_000395 [Kappamyces sp. JEL0680]|nr:hypothetical protein HDU91_000395 [Kappamyces sp. JEL0680]